MGTDGQQKESRNVYLNSLAPRKRTREVDDEKSKATAEKASKTTVSIRSQFEMDCVQTCRSFIRGRFLKTNDKDDPLKCTETHNKPKRTRSFAAPRTNRATCSTTGASLSAARSPSARNASTTLRRVLLRHIS